MSDDRPTLIQLDISHYSEKVRWALDRKQVPHVRRSPLPGSHIPIAFVLTRGGSITLPLLQMEGRTITDSTAIIAALEQRYPQPPLYPTDPEQRRRALELEDFFDEELGPHARLLPFHELTNEPEMFAAVAAEAVPGPLGKAKGLVGLYARTYTGLRFGVRDDAAAAVAREKIVAALDRVEAELTANGSNEFLVGPDEGPLPADSPTPPRFAAFRAEIEQRPGYVWVEETFRRHRHPAHAETASAASN
jgi:glutathione S-transferase